MLSADDMERVLENLDRRLRGVEQILPTLATKSDLERFATRTELERFATKADLERYATKADLERFATKADLERFATKADLKRYATKKDVSAAVDTMRRHTDIRFEDLRDDISKVAEAVGSLVSTVQANQTTLEAVVVRLDRHEDVLNALVRKHGI